MNNQNQSSGEFNQVHAAIEALQSYINSGRNMDTIKVIPINSIHRYDVWKCVFEAEPEATRELQIKELRHILLKPNVEIGTLSAMLCIVLLTSIDEQTNSPLSLDDATAIVVDTVGDPFIATLINEAEKRVVQRKKIVCECLGIDQNAVEGNLWVAHAVHVLNAIKYHASNLHCPHVQFEPGQAIPSSVLRP